MKVKWTPHPKQIKALQRAEFEILFGGARGGGKTDTGMAWLLYDIDKPHYRALVIRRNASDLTDWVDRATDMFLDTGVKVVGSPATFIFPSGAKIRTGHLKDEDTYTKYQGHEYQKILIEELTQIPTEERYLRLIASCRSIHGDIKPQVFCTTNPGEVGHKWVKQRWRIASNEWGKPFKDNGISRIFIHATVEDNPTLVNADPGYIKYLDSLPEDLKQQWRYGNWDEVDILGAYYASWMNKASKEGRITDVPYLEEEQVHTAWDLGMNDSMAIWFFQVKGDMLRIIDYYENNGFGLSHYVKHLKNKPYIYGVHLVPHDISVKEFNGLTRLELMQDMLRGHEIRIVPKTDPQDGIEKVRMLLGRCLFDLERCTDGIEALRNYRKVWDEKNLVFRNTPSHDRFSHGADAFRYLAVGLSMIGDDEPGAFEGGTGSDPY